MTEVSPEKSSRSLLPSYREEFRGKVQRRVSKGWKEKGCPPASRPAPLLQALWDQERWGEVTARVVGKPHSRSCRAVLAGSQEVLPALRLPQARAFSPRGQGHMSLE